MGTEDRSVRRNVHSFTHHAGTHGYSYKILQDKLQNYEEIVNGLPALEAQLDYSSACSSRRKVTQYLAHIRANYIFLAADIKKLDVSGSTL